MLFTHALRESGNIAYAWIEAGKTDYPEIKTGRKDWICRD